MNEKLANAAPQVKKQAKNNGFLKLVGFSIASFVIKKLD
jgi:hypothetical protein